MLLGLWKWLAFLRRSRLFKWPSLLRSLLSLCGTGIMWFLLPAGVVWLLISKLALPACCWWVYISIYMLWRMRDVVHLVSGLPLTLTFPEPCWEIQMLRRGASFPLVTWKMLLILLVNLQVFLVGLICQWCWCFSVRASSLQILSSAMAVIFIIFLFFSPDVLYWAMNQSSLGNDYIRNASCLSACIPVSGRWPSSCLFVPASSYKFCLLLWL